MSIKRSTRPKLFSSATSGMSIIELVIGLAISALILPLAYSQLTNQLARANAEEAQLDTNVEIQTFVKRLRTTFLGRTLRAPMSSGYTLTSASDLTIAQTARTVVTSSMNFAAPVPKLSFSTRFTNFCEPITPASNPMLPVNFAPHFAELSKYGKCSFTCNSGTRPKVQSLQTNDTLTVLGTVASLTKLKMGDATAVSKSAIGISFCILEDLPNNVLSAVVVASYAKANKTLTTKSAVVALSDDRMAGRGEYVVNGDYNYFTESNAFKLCPN